MRPVCHLKHRSLPFSGDLICAFSVLVDHVIVIMGSVKRDLRGSLGAAVGSSIVCIGVYCLPHRCPLILCPFRQQIALFVIPYVHAGGASWRCTDTIFAGLL
jgi:hypothetical protein